jgi:hypothetical protein
VRIVTYVIAFILLVVVIVVPVAYVSDKKDRFKRNRVIRKFKSRTDSSLNELNAQIYEFYKDHGLTVLKRMRKALADDKEFQKLLGKYNDLASEGEGSTTVNITLTTVPDERFVTDPVFVVRSMLKLGLISKAGESYTKNDERISAMNEFIRFAMSKKT